MFYTSLCLFWSISCGCCGKGHERQSSFHHGAGRCSDMDEGDTRWLLFLSDFIYDEHAEEVSSPHPLNALN